MTGNRNSALIASLSAAVAASPHDVPLRVHLAELMLADGDTGGAITHAAAALQSDPGHVGAQAVMARALAPAAPAPGPAVDAPPASHPSAPPAAPAVGDGGPAVGSSYDEAAGEGTSEGFDWSRAEAEVDGLAAPMFVGEDAPVSDTPPVAPWEVERTQLRLSDVGGMAAVKERIEVAFLAPMRNPEMRRIYGKSLRGGLLLYGPPGCGKTFLARAVAGELGAKFISVGLSDILDMWIGRSERNLHELFELARTEAPVVLFLDEIDALGQKRVSSQNMSMRTAVNQLLMELDGVDGSNDGVFVLAATNQPWDVDPALRRPGRLDRTVLVLPPDAEARAAIFHFHLKERPVEGIDLADLARRTEGYSGADIAHVCESAAERAMMAGIRSGTVRFIRMEDLLGALSEVRPSIGPWLESARNVVEFGGEDAMYADLRDYLKRRRR